VPSPAIVAIVAHQPPKCSPLTRVQVRQLC
jgi:hypothetical protein